MESQSIGLITSQDVTAPKQRIVHKARLNSLITSQDVTAPKRDRAVEGRSGRLITSQDVTAPKPLAQIPHCEEDVHPNQRTP